MWRLSTRRLARLAAVPLTLIWADPAVASPEPAMAVAAKPPAIVGGGPSAACAWPSVVAMQAGGLCTGTLVHPRVVAYAAHCGTLHAKVYFGEDVAAPAREVDTLFCERNSDIFAVSSEDYAFCVLAEPVDDIPVTPLLAGCEAELIEIGTPVTIVGFGDTTSEGEAETGIKHEAQTEITGLLSMIGIGGMGTGADGGDSGGPALVQLDDGSWRVLGIVSGGGGDGATVQYVPAPLTIAWIEAQSGIDVSPCHDVDAEGQASWAPTPACEGFFVATQAGASWASSCDAQASEASTSCGPPWTEIEDLGAPSVNFVAPLDGAVLLGPPTVFDVIGEADDGGGIGVAGVSLKVDGDYLLDEWGAVAVDAVPPYRFEGVWLETPGAHELELEAVDALGKLGSKSITVQVGDGEGGGETETGAESAESDTGASQTGEESSESGMLAEEGTAGCGCTTATGPGEGGAQRGRGWVTLMLLSAVLGLRRRRRSSADLCGG